MRPSLATSVLALLLALPGPALATKPCYTEVLKAGFMKAQLGVLRLVADARLVCGQGMQPLPREVVRPRAMVLDLPCDPCPAGAGCDCRLPDGTATSSR
jgi:hypothetical protein